jgi:hypothetical protein
MPSHDTHTPQVRGSLLTLCANSDVRPGQLQRSFTAVWSGSASVGELETFNSWFFHDSDGDLGTWADSLNTRLEPLQDHKPAGVSLHENVT